jgi:glycosyltransferase involved in cell wall biosynthesis
MMRIAVVSPFIDKRHGTERCVAEQIEHLIRNFGYEVHLYSQRVEDIEVNDGKGRFIWHKIPDLPGPHLLKYLWWFVANQVIRNWNRKAKGCQYDLVYSPGINCWDADVISVHIVFAEFYRQVKDMLRLTRSPFRTWPRVIHRWLYYHLIMALERRIYGRHHMKLVAISKKVANDLHRHYSVPTNLPIAYHGIDICRFNPQVRASLRPRARKVLNLDDGIFAILLIGNDWKKKGLDCLLEALHRLRDLPIHLLVVGQDDPNLYLGRLRERGLNGRVTFLPPRPDVEVYYAAADAYVAPSLEDAFALPPAEAMACGLPVIVSSHAGVSEIVRDGVDGLILKDPTDPEELARLLQLLHADDGLRECLSQNAPHKARQFTWERNAQGMHEVFVRVVNEKRTCGH